VAALPDPPLKTMPGVEAHDVELLCARVLAATASPASPATAVLWLRYLAAHYGPPEIAALARPEQLPRAPRHGQVERPSSVTRAAATLDARRQTRPGPGPILAGRSWYPHRGAREAMSASLHELRFPR
jgi:hypothetical protein